MAKLNRLVVLKRLRDGHTVKDIACEFGVTKQAVYQNLQYDRKRSIHNDQGLIKYTHYRAQHNIDTLNERIKDLENMYQRQGIIIC